jgi:asparagine synthase (glutamine-hydrolysing)
MCGFGGFINHKEAIGAQQIAAIAKKADFRGPDSCGIRIFDDQFKKTDAGRHGIFFNRLAIIDLDSRSDQPFEDEQHLLVFNGEIYNYTDLKTTLKKQGVLFKTTSDTEVLFHALKLWGRDALQKLNGMFAFFWLDKIQGKYIAGRDRLGIKPLYYYFDKGSFYFGSELYSILRMLNTVPPVSANAVNMYLWMQYVSTPHTIIEGINKLPPGSLISGSVNDITQLSTEIYWDCYSFVSEDESLSNPSNIEDILKDSVERQLQADVPIGLFLSSGVDSSLLAAIVNKYFAKNQDVNFFTISFDESTATDESKDATEFIAGFRNKYLVNHRLQIDPRFLQDHLNEQYKYYDEPFGDYASLLNWAISKKARDFVTVALSGDGADELFWGYPRYNKWQELRRFNSFPTMSKMVTKTAAIMPAGNLKSKLQKRFISDPVEAHFDQFLLPAFRSYFKKKMTDFDLWATKNVSLVKNRDDLAGILDVKTYLADAMLYKVDRSSMATSLEVRVPYLDNKVLEYALKLDLGFKSNSKFKNKAILKELLLKLAPHYDANRPKKGFSFPLKKWLRTEWRDQVLSSITPFALNEVSLPAEPFMKIVRDFYEKDTNSHVEIWYLFNLVLWKQNLNNLLRQ